MILRIKQAVQGGGSGEGKCGIYCKHGFALSGLQPRGAATGGETGSWPSPLCCFQMQADTSSSRGSDKCEGSMILPILSSVEQELHHLQGGTFETQNESSARSPWEPCLGHTRPQEGPGDPTLRLVSCCGFFAHRGCVSCWETHKLGDPWLLLILCFFLGLHYNACGLSLVVEHGLSCPTTCEILTPRRGLEPASPALEGRFLTTEPSGKSPLAWFLNAVSK